MKSLFNPNGEGCIYSKGLDDVKKMSHRFAWRMSGHPLPPAPSFHLTVTLSRPGHWTWLASPAWLASAAQVHRAWAPGPVYKQSDIVDIFFRWGLLELGEVLEVQLEFLLGGLGLGDSSQSSGQWSVFHLQPGEEMAIIRTDCQIVTQRLTSQRTYDAALFTTSFLLVKLSLSLQMTYILIFDFAVTCSLLQPLAQAAPWQPLASGCNMENPNALLLRAQ